MTEPRTRVWDYSSRRYDVLGRIRWRIEWITLAPSAEGKEDIDPDYDLNTHAQYSATEADALAQGQKIYDQLADAGKLFYGTVNIEKQQLLWFVQADRVADWQAIGESIEISE